MGLCRTVPEKTCDFDQKSQLVSNYQCVLRRCWSRAVASLEEANGHQHLAFGHGDGCEEMSPLSPPWSRVAIRGIFKYIFNTKPCIVMHSSAPIMGTTSVFSEDLYDMGKMKTTGRGCRMNPEGSKIETEGRQQGGVLAEGQQALPARGSDSYINKTTFLRQRPK